MLTARVSLGELRRRASVALPPAAVAGGVHQQRRWQVAPEKPEPIDEAKEAADAEKTTSPPVDQGTSTSKRPAPPGPEAVFAMPPLDTSALSADEAAEQCTKSASFTKLISQPLNFRQLQIIDVATHMTSATTHKLLRVGWLVPAHQLQVLMHKRYEIEAFAECNTTGAPLGLLMMTCGHRVPTTSKASWLTKTFLSQPHDAVSFATLAVDRQHWNRSLWSLGGFNTSLGWGKIPKYMHNLRGLYTDRAVKISTDKPLGSGGARYTCEVEGTLTIQVTEEASSVFDPASRTVPGFSNNESAMSALGVPTETINLATGSEVMRQPQWSPPTNPQLAGHVSVSLVASDENADRWYEMLGGPLPVADRPPLFAWLDDDMPASHFFECEVGIEHEHEPFIGATALSGKNAELRFAHNAMQRKQRFQDGVRSMAYASMKGEQLPR